MDVLLETPPPPPLETSRTLSMFILQVLRLSVLYKSIKVHLGQSQKLIMSIEIYLKRKYSYENAGFCTLNNNNNNNNNNDLIAFPLSGYSMLQINNKLSLIN